MYFGADNGSDGFQLHRLSSDDTLTAYDLNLGSGFDNAGFFEVDGLLHFRATDEVGDLNLYTIDADGVLDVVAEVNSSGSFFTFDIDTQPLLGGASGNDVISGLSKDDDIFGFDGEDLLMGNLGHDTLDGGAGNDTLEGGGGDDILIGGLGADVLNGGSGVDVANYTGSTSGLRVSLTSPGTNTGEAVGDSFVSIENIFGSYFDDLLVGNAASNYLVGRSGDDSLYGLGGNDTFNGGIGADKLFGGSQSDELFGNSGNDILRGEGGIDVLNGGTGNDLLIGGTSADRFVFDTDNGVDRIFDFDADSEVIEINGLSFTSFADVQAAMVDNVAANFVTITISAGNTIRIDGVQSSDLRTSNFDLDAGSQGSSKTSVFAQPDYLVSDIDFQNELDMMSEDVMSLELAMGVFL